MANKKKFYVTTPVYYANGNPHIGGAYTTIAADVLARWNKLQGKDVFFLTGTDEHGQKIQETAEKEGVKPKEFVDKIAKKFIEAFKLLNISNDNFIRTTDAEHEKEVKRILQELYDKKFIYKGNYESYYCVGCEQYMSESDLVDGKCPLHNTTPELKKEEAYLFKLSAFQDKLLKLIESGKYEILPINIRKEILEFIKSGLKDISISRLKKKIYWGIEMPFDKEHTCYVWVDAFWNYLTGLQEKRVFKKFWPADVQLMARDIIRVHATIWPALLLATENKLPKTLFVHGYFTINGKKMSKSLGNIIDPIELVNKYGADSVRYYLMRNISFGSDGDVSEQDLIKRHNSELADKLGNLISRVASLIEKFGMEKSENKLLRKLKLKEIEKKIGNYELDKALNLIFEFIDSCNFYVQENELWKTCNKKQLYELADSIKAVSVLLFPFMPETCEKIAEQFGFKIEYNEINNPLKISRIAKGEILFRKILEDKINKAEKVEGVMVQGDIKFLDFEKLDLRVAQIKKIEDIEGTDNLYKLTIEVGSLGKRVICAGIKGFYSKEQLKNKKIVIVANLEPRILKGIESRGMLLAAGHDNGKCVLLSLDSDIEPGTKIS